MASVENITPARLKELMSSAVGIQLIDVRTPAEYEEVHLRDAINIPLDKLSTDKLANDSKALVFICKSGGRGRMAAERIAPDRETVYNVEGGTKAAVDAGIPAVHGRKCMSLERQVRIAAGGLVLLGFALSFIHPALIGLSVFVGAGLVFAGITDTCAMGMLIAKMPWNQAAKQSGSQCALK